LKDKDSLLLLAKKKALNESREKVEHALKKGGELGTG